MYQWTKQKLSDWSFAHDQRKYARDVYFRAWTGDSAIEDNQPWEIIKGPFKGLVFYFDRLNFVNLTFSMYFKHFQGKSISPKNKKFQKIARKILLNLINDMLNGDKNLQLGLKPGEEYEDRNSYSEEPLTERAVCKKGSAVPEDGTISGPQREAVIRRDSQLHHQIQSETNKRNPKR